MLDDVESSLGIQARAFVAAALRHARSGEWRDVAEDAKALWRRRSQDRGW